VTQSLAELFLEDALCPAEVAQRFGPSSERHEQQDSAHQAELEVRVAGSRVQQRLPALLDPVAPVAVVGVELQTQETEQVVGTCRPKVRGFCWPRNKGRRPLRGEVCATGLMRNPG
jgi:hypothetical protein